MSETLRMLRKTGYRMRRRSSKTRGKASHGRARLRTMVSGLTSGGGAMKEMKESTDLMVKKADWENYMRGIGEGANMNMTKMLMIVDVNGHKGVTMMKGHLLTTGVTEAKGHMNLGDPGKIVDAVDGDLGQALLLKGEVKTASNGDFDMNI